jgi:hypothetical protein
MKASSNQWKLSFLDVVHVQNRFLLNLDYGWKLGVYLHSPLFLESSALLGWQKKTSHLNNLLQIAAENDLGMLAVFSHAPRLHL